MADPIKIAEKYNAQSDINGDALSSFTAYYPDVYVGNTFVDYNGLKWQYTYIYADNGRVVVLAAFVESGSVTNYIANTSLITIRDAKYIYSDAYVLPTSGTLPTSYTRTDMKYGEITQLTIDGGTPLVQDIDFTFTPETGTTTFITPISYGQSINTLYLQKPSGYGA